MGKPTGFLEYPRELPLAQAPAERIHHWHEFHEHADGPMLQKQGARCMDCGVPFCHTGTLIEGMAAGCPINNLIPEWNDLVYRGLWREALERCTRPTTSPSSPAASVRRRARARACSASASRPSPSRASSAPSSTRASRKAGSCPSRRQAHRQEGGRRRLGAGRPGLRRSAQQGRPLVTVFERADRIGGLLMYGIPNMKLDKKLRPAPRRPAGGRGRDVRHQLRGRQGLARGQNCARTSMPSCCAAAPRRPTTSSPRPRAGKLKGIHFAMEFLHANTKSLLDSNHADGKYISAKDKDVIVIGGGDTGTDCVGTSLRHGCKSLLQLEIVPQPPLNRAPTIPGLIGGLPDKGFVRVAMLFCCPCRQAHRGH